MATKGRTKKEKFPEIKESRQGAFTKWAKNNGFKDACSAASAVMNAFGNKVKCGWNWLISRLMFTLPLCPYSKCKCKK